MNKNKNKESFGNKRASATLMLSLFLLLLSFFILLNAISTLNESKSKKILDAVSQTFQRNVLEMARKIFVSTAGDVPIPDTVIEELGELWVTSVPLVKIQELKKGKLLLLNMDANEIFSASSTRLRNDRLLFLDRLIQTLQNEYETSTLYMEFIIGVEDFNNVNAKQIAPPDKETVLKFREEISRKKNEDIFDPSSYDNILPPIIVEENQYDTDGEGLGFGRAVSFGRFLEQKNVSKLQYSIGLQEEDPNHIKLRFELQDKPL